ncbi:MAG: preprotein translocase subunit SecG [Ruminococcaceae bacterium]|nr:preprotein translocase subunit SecG [Oscillospiraceae bacterium]
MEIAIGIILIISAIFLIIAVLMQQGKNHNLSGAIAGGAETFFGKTKGSTLDKKLSKLTSVVAVLFCVVVLISFLMQDTETYGSYDANGVVPSETTEETAAVEAEDTAAETAAAETDAAEAE